jgi:predicted methyltransferase
MGMRAGYLLTSKTARDILQGKLVVSLDLGISLTKAVVKSGEVLLPDNTRIPFDDLRTMAGRADSVYFLREGRIYVVAISDRHYYKLVPTGGAPTIEIDGVRMHRTTGTTPERDAMEKIDLLNIDGGMVLDTCTGLGYTASESFKQGAEGVFTVEKDPNVLRIAYMNPWSENLFSSNRIYKTVGDVHNLIDIFPANFFDYIIHDPPTFSHAGHLYGRAFYNKLYRVIKPGGRLFHYTGEPGSKFRGTDLKRGVLRRLRESGFRKMEFHESVMGFMGRRTLTKSFKGSV